MSNDNLKLELEIIKKLLIVQLVKQGIGIRDIAKITGMSSKTLYKFLPKNLEKKNIGNDKNDSKSN